MEGIPTSAFFVKNLISHFIYNAHCINRSKSL